MQKKLWVVAMLAAPLLASCGSLQSGASYDDRVSANDIPYQAPPSGRDRTVTQDKSRKLQCVPYAREHSGVKIYGDAWTWWDQAAGKFQRETLPEAGAVMVLSGYAGPERGHVAVVRDVISAREISVDHANWLNDGSIYLNDPVTDVSEDNDWSAVRIWNTKTGAWGGNIYPVQGFILPNRPLDQLIARVESSDNGQ